MPRSLKFLCLFRHKETTVSGMTFCRRCGKIFRDGPVRQADRLKWPVIPSVTNRVTQIRLHDALKYKRVELEHNATKKILGAANFDGEFFTFENPIEVNKGEQYTLWFCE